MEFRIAPFLERGLRRAVPARGWLLVSRYKADIRLGCALAPKNGEPFRPIDSSVLIANTFLPRGQQPIKFCLRPHPGCKVLAKAVVHSTVMAVMVEVQTK